MYDYHLSQSLRVLDGLLTAPIDVVVALPDVFASSAVCRFSPPPSRTTCDLDLCACIQADLSVQLTYSLSSSLESFS